MANDNNARKGATRHCCYGLCKSDSRYGKEISWVVFPKPHLDLERCKRWVHACGRSDFTVDRVKKWTYICNLHFVDGKGPSADHPDPIPAAFTQQQLHPRIDVLVMLNRDHMVEKFRRKRRAPTARGNVTKSKRPRYEYEVAESQTELHTTPVQCPHNGVSTSTTTTEFLLIDETEVGQPASPESCHQPFSVRPSSKDASTETVTVVVNDVGTQTMFVCSDELANKIVNSINNDQSIPQSAQDIPERASTAFHDDFSFESVSSHTDGKFMKFYTGLTLCQFLHLFRSLGTLPERLTFWHGKRYGKTKQRYYATKISPINQLFLTLVRLRQAFPNKDLSFRFNISASTVSTIVITWVQFLYQQTELLRYCMFPSINCLHFHKINLHFITYT